MGNLVTTLGKCFGCFQDEREATLQSVHVLASNGLNESKDRQIIDSVTAKLQGYYTEFAEHKIDDVSYSKYSVPNSGRVPWDSTCERGLIVILSKDQNTNSWGNVKSHLDNVRAEVEIENAIAVTPPSENEGFIISKCPSVEMYRILVSLLPDNILEQERCKNPKERTSPPLDCKVRVFLTGLNANTLGKVNEQLSTCIDESCLQPHIIKVSKRSEAEDKLRDVDEDSVVICCVNDNSRLVIMSDTEQDEIGEIVRAAEEKCGEQKVMILVCGHEDLPQSSQESSLYDRDAFNERFFKYQPRLEEKANKEKNFLSMKWTLNEGQITHIKQWIQKCSENFPNRVQEIAGTDEGCEGTVFSASLVDIQM